jgi:hypothetical protein
MGLDMYIRIDNGADEEKQTYEEWKRVKSAVCRLVTDREVRGDKFQRLTVLIEDGQEGV